MQHRSTHLSNYIIVIYTDIQITDLNVVHINGKETLQVKSTRWEGKMLGQCPP